MNGSGHPLATLRGGLALLLALLGVALAQDTGAIRQYLAHSRAVRIQDMLVGDPVATLRGWEDQLNATALREGILGLAGALIVVGFALSAWRATTVQNGVALRGALVNLVACALFLSLCFNFGALSPVTISSIATAQWSRSYTWGREVFARDLDTQIVQAQEGMYEMLAQVVGTAATVTTVGGVAKLGFSVIKGTASGLRLGQAVGGALKGDTGVLATGGRALGGRIFGRLNLALSWLEYLMLGLTFIVTGSGFLVLVCVYLMPLAIAALMFGNASWLWRALGTIVGSWFAILLMPLVTSIAINLAFVRPAAAMQAYSQTLALGRAEARQEAEAVSRQVDAQARQAAQDCASATQADPKAADAPVCQQLHGSWFANLLSNVTDTLLFKVPVLSALIDGLLDTINRSFVMIGVVVAGLVFGLGLMLGLPAFCSSFFSGMGLSLAANLGSHARRT